MGESEGGLIQASLTNTDVKAAGEKAKAVWSPNQMIPFLFQT